jgi:hypothetical protein
MENPNSPFWLSEVAIDCLVTAGGRIEIGTRVPGKVNRRLAMSQKSKEKPRGFGKRNT